MVFKPFYLQLVLPFNNENMGRYKDYSKWYIEDYKKTIDMSFLRKHGYLGNHNKTISGEMRWLLNGKETGNIGIEVINIGTGLQLRESSDRGEVLTSSDKGQGLLSSDKFRQDKILRVYFTQTDNNTGKKGTIGL